jgi:glycosyltransferase involved in cell wall biosynthesis
MIRPLPLSTTNCQLPTSRRPFSVALFQRRPVPGHFSMEAIFDEVCVHLPDEIAARRTTGRFTSQGVFRRLYAIGEAFWRRQEVNHITGDVHFLALGLPKRNTILTIHDCVPLRNHPSGLRHLLLKLFWFTLPVRRAAMITVVSEATKQELLPHVPVDPEKVRVVPACIASHFQPCPKAFNTDCPRILHIGTAPNKNLPRLCEALRGLRCKLDVVGRLDSGHLEALERNQIDYENASGLSDAEMVDRYRHCDLVAFVSTYEGFGMPILEANTVERPIVAGNVCSMPEVAGEAACLVDPNDVASIRQGIERVIADAAYRDQLVEAGRSNRERFQP